LPASAKPLAKPGCQETATPAPASGFTGNFGWTMQYGFTPNDGLVISEIYLNGKRMAKQMSVPYFWITTSSATNPNLFRTRGELTPAGTGSSIRSRLVSYKINPADPDKILIEAKYAIDQIPGAPKACLNITQKYEFYRAGSSPPDLVGPCEPSNTVIPCNKFRPMIEYSFHGGDGEFLSSLNTPIRLHFQNTVASGNTVALTRDFDTKFEAGTHPSVPFRAVFNPLESAWWSKVIVQRSTKNPDKDANTVDNFHQTDNKVSVLLPGAKGWVAIPIIPIPVPTRLDRAGCPECVHFHWRWSNFLSGPNFRNGIPIVPPGSDQAVDIQVVPFKNVFENYHPTDYYQLFHAKEPLRNPAKGVKEPYDVVLWYSPTGFAPSDTFFWHTAWFTPKRLTGSNIVAVEQSNDSLNASGVQDGPVSVDFGSVYETGNTTFSSYDPSTVAPLPAGYAALNNTGYLIDTTGVVSGPHVVNFSAASVTDQTVFNNLRIFYAEPDAFDPEKPVWVDATILSPDTPGPNFSAKTLSARSGRLGVFVIGKLVQSVPSPGVANLRVTLTDSSDPITAGNNLTYTVTVANDGPQAATEVMLKDSLSPDVTFVSVNPSQGTCKTLDGVVYCSLNSMAAGGSTTVILVVKVTEGTDSFPLEGKMIANTVFVRAKEDDGDPSNDWVSEETNALPNPNKPPIVNITSPITGTFFVGPANIALSAVATDSDGTITKVDFFDNGDLIGSGALGTGNTYSVTKTIGNCGPQVGQVTCGNHTFVAVATDNAGRQNVSSPIDVIVNGTATINITSPSSGSLASPGSNMTLTASASLPSGVLSKVEFFANEQPIGQGTSTGGSQYSLAWANVPAGMYSIIAVATDGSQIPTWSAPITLTVGTPPTVTISSPVENTGFPTATNISVSAIAQSSVGSIVKVDFYASGVLIGTASDVGTDNYMVTWRHLADGSYTLTAVASDNLGLTSTSAPVHIVVNTVPASGQQVWFDDALPVGATKHGDTDVDWYWVDANPGSFSGTKSHQSRNFAQLNAPNSVHQHSFDGATQTLPVNAGDKLFTYVFLDINSLPREIMLQWKDANGWEHRAYWGENNINLGINNKVSRRNMGPLPKPGQWVRLEVPASAVGLEGSTLDGMAFTLDGGRATWDVTGKTTANAPPPPTTPPGDFVWIEDALPAGAVTSGVNEVNWTWVPAPLYSGQQAHRNFVGTNSNGEPKYRSHSFTGAQTPMTVNPGDVLFTYVYLGDPRLENQLFTPNQIMLQWYDGTSWEHRAYWGENFIGQQVANIGVQGTESQRDMGGLPAARGWYRLEVPASYVGLEGKSVSGMAFSAFRNDKNPFVTWDRSGKSAQLTTVPQPLSATVSVWKAKNPSYGYSFETNDQGLPGHAPQTRDWFFAHPNQAAATVPLHRFRSATNTNEYFYSQYKELYDGHGWIWSGIAHYVYPNGSTPGTVPLYLFHDGQTHYYLTTDETVSGMTRDGNVPWAYVFAVNPQIPAAPSSLTLGSCSLFWRDNSITETGFEIQEYALNTGKWETVATRGANSTSYCFSGDCDVQGSCTTTPDYKARVLAYNGFGVSPPSNVVQHGAQESAKATEVSNLVVDPPTSPPQVNITRPADGEVVDHNFAIFANAFDADGNGTIVKVEFFADGNKLGEVYNHPYVFFWDDAPSGPHSLTARVSDNAGASTTSSPVNITVGSANLPPMINVTAPTSGAVFNVPATITISASASDSNGSISKVEFFQGPTKLGEDATAPYSFNWTNVGAGSYSLTATATDNLGATTTSAAVNITVNGSNVSPTVSITAPTSGAVFTAPASFSINASASDADGSISKVEFFQWGTKLGEVNTVPYSFSWTNVPAGNYALTAMATDDRGASSTSGAVSVTVTQPPPPSDYRAYTDFSNVQGYRNWYYLESTGVQMSFDAANNRWQGSETYPQLFNYGGHPGQSVDAVRQWRAPQAGTVRITGIAADTNGICGDGVVVSVKKGAQVLWQQIIENANSTGFTYDLNTTVAVGDQINFVINKRSLNNGCDSTRFDSSITYTSISNQSPIANAGGQYTGAAGTAVQFNGSSSYDSDGTIVSYSWTFGDGGGGAGTTPSHIYSAAGTYTATLTVTDNSSAQSSANATVTIGNSNQLPVANAGGPYSGVVGTSIQFNGGGSFDPDGMIVSYAWTFGDGGTGSGATPAHTYTAMGNYIASLTVTDNGGGQSISTSAVIVGNLPSSTEIVFASNRDGTSQLYHMNTDGSGQVRLTNNFANDESPHWSPNHARIVFQSDRTNPFSGVADIYVMNADGSDQTRLTTDVADDSAPVWSPDGTKIAFQSARNGVNYQVYVMNADGSGQVNVSNSTANDGQPSWSPDGTRLAFASDRDHPGIASIYVMNANGSNQTRLTFSGSEAKDEQPTWSPDGARIAFVSTRDSIVVTWQETDDEGLVLVKTKVLTNKEVYRMNSDGTGQVRLTNTLESDDSPVWSRDGLKLLFRSDRERECCDPGAQIWVMNADGSNQLNLSNNGFGDYGPNW
jgi:uncharacterized repeat protein (TIGR01451 family)